MDSNELKRELFHAVVEAEIEKIAQLLSVGADINCTNNSGLTPLAVAVYNSNIKCVHSLTQYLLENGADINKCQAGAFTPLYLAVIYKRPNIVQTLLERGANPNINFFPEKNPKIISSALDWAYTRFLHAIIKEKKGLYKSLDFILDEIEGYKGLMLLLMEAGARRFEKDVIPEYS